MIKFFWWSRSMQVVMKGLSPIKCLCKITCVNMHKRKVRQVSNSKWQTRPVCPGPGVVSPPSLFHSLPASPPSLSLPASPLTSIPPTRWNAPPSAPSHESLASSPCFASACASASSNRLSSSSSSRYSGAGMLVRLRGEST